MENKGPMGKGVFLIKNTLIHFFQPPDSSYILIHLKSAYFPDVITSNEQMNNKKIL